MSCSHVSSDVGQRLTARGLQPPRYNQPVYREDCTLCFDSIDDPSGLNVCLTCFNGGCAGDRNHALIHYEATGHPLFVNIKRTRKMRTRDEPPKKITKLAIAAETEEDRYDTKTSVGCYADDLVDIEQTGKLAEVVSGVLSAMTFSRSTEVQAWEQDLTPCEHTLALTQEASRKIESQDLGHCSMCDLKENLWLCLQCGNLGCGRAQFGGVDGNSHGLAHYDEMKHPFAVKLGSLTPDGGADIYCYACNEERIDPELSAHLAHWGINIAEREKTEKSLTELQIEQNLKWDFSMTTEDGKELEPVFGPGLTGLKNLGNSCYLSSALQCLFDLDEFKLRYYHPKDIPPVTSGPAEDLETQLQKIADGLLSGRYSKPVHPEGFEDDAKPHQTGLAPSMLKAIIGKDHPEFSTMRQQDSFEFLQHLFKLINRSRHPAPFSDPTTSFQFALEQRLQCLSCKKVRYKTDFQDNISVPVPVRRVPKSQPEDDDQFEPVTLSECLDIFTGVETVDLTCPACGSKDGFTKQSLFKTLPKNLAINARRFEIVNWVPTKLDIPLIVNDTVINFDKYLSPGVQPTEELLPEDAPQSQAFVPNEAALEQLEAMGFSRVRGEHALHATGNADAEAAMNWLFAHMEDPNIDIPLNLTTTAVDSGVADTESIATLTSMGFSAAHAEKALKNTQGNMERAVEWIFSHPDDGDEAPVESATSQASEPGLAEKPANYELRSIICHKGRSIHTGHYVAFIRKDSPELGGQSWVLFNDEKVVKTPDAEEMKKFAYVYILTRA